MHLQPTLFHRTCWTSQVVCVSCLLRLDLWLGGPIGPGCIPWTKSAWTIMIPAPVPHYVVSHQQ